MLVCELSRRFDALVFQRRQLLRVLAGNLDRMERFSIDGNFGIYLANYSWPLSRLTHSPQKGRSFDSFWVTKNCHSLRNYFPGTGFSHLTG
jgi:hypothetical protein